MEWFRFVEKIEPTARHDELVAKIPTGISNAEELFQLLFERLHLPGYFGFNWNALSDCLQDLHWLETHTVILRHEDLPQLPPAELRIYLEVLSDAAGSWEQTPDHSLYIELPATTRKKVTRLLMDTEE